MYFTMGKPQELTHYAMMKAVPLLTALQLFLDFPAVWISDYFGWCENGRERPCFQKKIPHVHQKKIPTQFFVVAF